MITKDRCTYTTIILRNENIFQDLLLAAQIRWVHCCPSLKMPMKAALRVPTWAVEKSPAAVRLRALRRGRVSEADESLGDGQASATDAREGSGPPWRAGGG